MDGRKKKNRRLIFFLFTFYLEINYPSLINLRIALLRNRICASVDSKILVLFSRSVQAVQGVLTLALPSVAVSSRCLSESPKAKEIVYVHRSVQYLPNIRLLRKTRKSRYLRYYSCIRGENLKLRTRCK